MAKTAKAKIKSENQPIQSGDCRQAIHWYTNMLAEELQAGYGCNRGLFATNFEADDQLLLDTALANLESKGIKPFIVSGSDLYKQADHVWGLALNQTKYGQPVLTELEIAMRNSQLLVLTNLDTPLAAHQLWYLYHYVLYPAALAEKPMLISTPLGYEEFVMYGAGCEDFEYAGWRITWEKLISLLNATVMNLYHCKQLQQENLPAMLLPEYRFYRALQERHLNVTPHYIANKYLFDFATIDETAKIKLNIECDFIHRFGLMNKESTSLLSKQIKRDKELINAGWQVLRFSAKEIAGSLDSCLDAIEEIQRNNNKKSSVGRFVNLPMLSVEPNLPVKDTDEIMAITHSIGPAAIIGGAGTGKSTCIAQRLAFLLAQGVSPERIVVLSYSAETIRPLKQAAEKVTPGRLLEKVNFYSWHDLGMRILKENVLAIKRKLPLKIESHPQKILQKLIAKYSKESDLTALEILGYPDETEVSQIISGFKANLINAQAARENAKNEREVLVAKIYAAYDDQLQKANKIDRDDVIYLAAQLLGQESELRAHYENLFEHIIVDEHQDVTIACDFLARILACPNDNIIFVGNPDEAIYEGQGAVPSLLAETSLRIPNASCYLLGHNWRAHPQITKHAEQFIRQSNIANDDKTSIEKNTIAGWGEGPTQAIVGPFQFRDEAAQIDWLMEKIEELLAQGRKPEEIAIICRTKEQFEEFEALLIPQGLVLGTKESDANLLPDEESDVLTFLKLVADPDGPKAREYFERICQLRFKGINPKLSTTITDVAESFNVSYLKAVEFYAEAAAEPFSNLLEQLVKRIRSMHRDKLSPYEIINLLKRPQWLGDYYKSIKLPPRVVYEPLKVMEQVQDAARSYKTVAEFIKGYSPAKTTQSESDSGQQVSLNLLTIAETKGREFQIVFVPDIVESIYPDSKQLNQNDEVRMFYVALTRARELLYLSCPRTIGNNLYLPSPYLQATGLELISIGLDEEPVKLEIETAKEKTIVVEGVVVGEIVEIEDKEKKILVEEPAEKIVNIESSLSEPAQEKLVKELPVAKSTNIFALIKEENAEIVEEINTPVIKKEKSDLSEAVRKVRREQIEGQIVPDKDVNAEVLIKKPKPKSASKSKENKCINCQTTLEINARFCGECGSMQSVPVQPIQSQVVCKSCGQLINVSEKFCGECGAPQ